MKADLVTYQYNTEEYIQKVDGLIREDQQIMLAQVASIVGISYRYAHPIMHYDLGYHNVCGVWVSKQATEKLVFVRDEEAYWMLSEVYQHAGGTISKCDICICSSSLEIKV